MRDVKKKAEGKRQKAEVQTNWNRRSGSWSCMIFESALVKTEGKAEVKRQKAEAQTNWNRCSGFVVVHDF
jgi:hypothetical protein